MSRIELGIVKRNSHHRTTLEEQRAMFNQVRFAPITAPDLHIPIETVACHAVTAGIKSDTPANLGDMLKSPYKAEFKAAHFENFKKVYRTGTWSAPVLRSLLPPDAVILPPRSVYAVKPSEVANVYDLQVRNCANGSKKIEGIHYDQSFAPVSSIDSIRMMIALGAAQRKTAYTLDISNAFQTSIVFQACTRTYNSLPPFFVDYNSLRWPDHPDLPGLTAQANAYAIQNFRSFQGQKDAGYYWHTLLMAYLVNTMGLTRHPTDHAVFLWQTLTAELFLALATDDFLVLTDDRELFLALKSGLEKLFKLT
jgi:hypothetical protein